MKFIRLQQLVKQKRLKNIVFGFSIVCLYNVKNAKEIVFNFFSQF